jgi:hypothetical protein
MKLSIYRYDPDKDAKPYMQDYEVELDSADRMLLDALVKAQGAGRLARVPPLLPRGRVRLGRDQHQRQERPRLHHQDRRAARPRHAAAAARACR